MHGLLVVRERRLAVAGARCQVPAREQQEEIRRRALERGPQLRARTAQVPLVAEHPRHADARRHRRRVHRRSIPIRRQRLVLAAEIVQRVAQPLPGRSAAGRQPRCLAVLGNRFLRVAGIHQHVPPREMGSGRVCVAGADQRQCEPCCARHGARRIMEKPPSKKRFVKRVAT